MRRIGADKFEQSPSMRQIRVHSKFSLPFRITRRDYSIPKVMKYIKPFITALLILLMLNSLVTAQNAEASPLEPVKKWFTAWELVSKEIYRIKTLQPVEFVFFDQTDVFSTSAVSIPNGLTLSGPSLPGRKLGWKKANHNGKITLPDGQIVPIGLMSFAAPLGKDGRNSFFVMPLPDFWRKAGVESRELGFENLLTGIFLHEFSHSQQMHNFGRKLSEYERKHTDKIEFSDDLIQNYFETDADYTREFLVETELFYAAAQQKSDQKLSQALDLYKKRQSDHFTGGKQNLKELDDFFLTMEGLGQFTMYAWMIHPKGGKVLPQAALTGVRRGKKSWSQDEGLALFLVLHNLAGPEKWAKPMFGTETVSVIELIGQNFGQTK
jgi:hypothetical protein